MSISAELFAQAMDRNDGDEDRSKWEAEFELNKLADNGNPEAQRELSHRAY